MKIGQIKAVLNPLGILQGANVYPDEPTPSFHMVYVDKGKGKEAIEAINAAGGDAMFVPACGSVYGDAIQVRRK